MSFLKNLFGKKHKYDLCDEKKDSRVPFLHGVIFIEIFEAEDLPDTDTMFFNIDSRDSTDAYVTGWLGDACLFQTNYVPNSLHPRWNEAFTVLVCHRASSLEIHIKDKEHIGASIISKYYIRSADLLRGEIIDGWFDLLKENGTSQAGRIKMSIKYTPVSECSATKEIFNNYFPPRKGNKVTLYQDADTPPLPIFDGLTHCNEEESQYVPPRAWIDLFTAIVEAQKFIYVTGWSVATNTVLVRDNPEYDPDEVSKIGELLKCKANEEGLTVLVMLWDEKMSSDNSPGMMGTHCKETFKYFSDSAVQCLLAPRLKHAQGLASEFVSSCYTHHQKSIIMDAPHPSNDSRRIIAFLGGLDITDGRYDSPEFPLYSSILGPKHVNDFYNNIVVGANGAVGPREPWHDCHAKVEGPIAMDIMKNFEERWRRQGESRVSQLFHIDSEGEIDSEAEIEENPWTVQLFRSITSDSCIFDFEKQQSLHSKLGILVEDSICRNMVFQIRNARNFIYMENQYFLGSAYSWVKDRKTLCQHIIPQEIAAKIVQKIKEGVNFMAYIVIPMFPEGDPSSAPIQEILFWQYRTMQSMYRRIAEALAEYGSPAHPTDYLSFYCLAKRESENEVPFSELQDPTSGSHSEKIRQTLRLPIYVHSKMTIIDDDYIIIGSANVNERSLAGNRDSEIAIGAFQPESIAENTNDEPRGDVHMYRMALWCAHLGGYDELYRNPSHPDCVAKVREVTRCFWDLYYGEEPIYSDVHLLPYPIQVHVDGGVNAIEAPYNVFADTNASVIGAKSGFLPGKVTT